MRISELFESIAKVIKVGDLKISILSHVGDQLRSRSIRPTDADRILKKIPQFKDEINQLENRQGFFIVHEHKEISLGMSKYGENDITWITVINTATPYAKGVDKIFYVK
jgi:hypothetical protein